MINLILKIENPFSNRWNMIRFWGGQTWLPNKFWEIQIDQSSTLVGVDLSWTTRQSHAGVRIELSLLGYSLTVSVYDQRHWNNDLGDWEPCSLH